MEIPKKSPAKSAVAPLAPFVRPRAVKRARTFLPEFRRRIFVRSDVHPWSAWSKTSNCRRAVPELLSAARPEWFSKGFREPRMSLPSTGSFNSTIQFSPSANLCFWDGIYSALPVRNPAWSQSFRFSWCHCDVFRYAFFLGNQNWHAQEDIPSYSIFTAHDFEFEGVSLWPCCPWTHQDDHGRIPVFVLAIGLQYLFES